MGWRHWAAAGASAAAVLTATGVALMPFCHLLHRCGCVAPWAGADAACNVHQQAGPQCPWCRYWALGGVAVGVTLAGEGLVFRVARRRRSSRLTATALAVASLPAWMFVAGVVTWLPTDYPHFLVEDARGRLGLPAGPIRCVTPDHTADGEPAP